VVPATNRLRIIRPELTAAIASGRQHPLGTIIADQLLPSVQVRALASSEFWFAAR
jgi:hypothetical protein